MEFLFYTLSGINLTRVNSERKEQDIGTNKEENGTKENEEESLLIILNLYSCCCGCRNHSYCHSSNYIQYSSD